MIQQKRPKIPEGKALRKGTRSLIESREEQDWPAGEGAGQPGARRELSCPSLHFSGSEKQGISWKAEGPWGWQRKPAEKQACWGSAEDHWLCGVSMGLVIMNVVYPESWIF